MTASKSFSLYWVNQGTSKGTAILCLDNYFSLCCILERFPYRNCVNLQPLCWRWCGALYIIFLEFLTVHCLLNFKVILNHWFERCFYWTEQKTVSCLVTDSIIFVIWIQDQLTSSEGGLGAKSSLTTTTNLLLVVLQCYLLVSSHLLGNFALPLMSIIKS